MKASHKRVIEYLKRGGFARCQYRSRTVYVAVWVGYNKYDSFACHKKTLEEMEELGLVVDRDPWANDREWVLPDSPEATGEKVLLDSDFDTVRVKV